MTVALSGMEFGLLVVMIVGYVTCFAIWFAFFRGKGDE